MAANGYPFAPTRLEAAVWNGAAKDMTQWNSVTIRCTVAPATPRAILAGPSSALATGPLTAIANTGTGIAQAQTIGAVGRYDIPGGEWIALGGTLTDGTFYIAGGQ